MAEEIDQSCVAIAAEAPDWLIVDHYALDASWEKAVAPVDARVMVLDDLANRPHACDLLLDQGVAHRPVDYVELVPDRTRMLLGPAYALLSPELVDLRPTAEVCSHNWHSARVLSIADSKHGGADGLDSAGAEIKPGSQSGPGRKERIIAGLAALSAPGCLSEMSAARLARAGPARVVQALAASPLELRSCTLEDAEPVWLWREADGAPRFYRSGIPTPWEEHRRWFEAALNDKRLALFIVEEEGRPVAHLRFDFSETRLPEVGLSVNPRRKGAGLGLSTVALAVRHARQLAWPGLSAEVHEGNAASARVFERNGFRQIGRRGAFLHYQIKLS